MATARVEPTGMAQDLATLATALDGETNISAAVVVPSAGQVDVGRHHVLVTGTAGSDITNAISAVGDCQLLGGTAIES